LVTADGALPSQETFAVRTKTKPTKTTVVRWTPVVLCLALLMLMPGVARAWDTRTHQQMTEIAWALIKARAIGAPTFVAGPEDYPSQQDCQRAVAFFQNLKAYQCRRDTGLLEYRDLPPGAIPPFSDLSMNRCRVGLQQGSFNTEPTFWGAKALAEYDTGPSDDFWVNELHEPNNAHLPKNYSPYLGVLALHNVPYVELPGQDPKVDYTGTVIGYYAGYGDYVGDTFGEVLKDSVLRDDNTALTLGEVFGTLAVCGGCFYCIPCLIAAGKGIDVFETEVGHYFRDLPYGPSNTLIGKRLEAFWHFQNTRPYNPNATSAYDDVDGFNHRYQKTTVWPDDMAYEIGASRSAIAIRPDLSHAPVGSYEITTGPDGHGLSAPQRPTGFWDGEGRHIANTTFMPADNMGRAHWDNWLKMRRSRSQQHGWATGKPYDLTSLGVALHALQDATSYHHGTGVLIKNHENYEKHVRNYFVSVRRIAFLTTRTSAGQRAAVGRWRDGRGRQRSQGGSRPSEAARYGSAASS
jgi:hypothetical protein